MNGNEREVKGKSRGIEGEMNGNEGKSRETNWNEGK